MNERDANLQVVAEGVFAWVQPDGSWWVNNAGAIGTPDGVIVIDTCATERRTLAFLRALANQTKGAPITCAVNTHQHGDHTGGNEALLLANAEIVIHKNARANMARENSPPDKVVTVCSLRVVRS